MIEIIPNWHPIFVHFTVAFFSTSVGFSTLAYIFLKLGLFPKIATDFEVVARWCLWAAGVSVIATVLAGLYAYNTVRHDAPSHLAMTNHRDWAVSTAGAIVLVTLWSLCHTYKKKVINIAYCTRIAFIHCMAGCRACISLWPWCDVVAPI